MQHGFRDHWCSRQFIVNQNTLFTENIPLRLKDSAHALSVGS